MRFELGKKLNRKRKEMIKARRIVEIERLKVRLFDEAFHDVEPVKQKGLKVSNKIRRN